MKTLNRRRKEQKTDYKKRIGLLKSDTPRIVFRKTNRYVLSQYITSKEAQDKIVIGVNSKDLMKYGWPKEFEGSLKSITASYLTGFLIGKKIIKDKLKTPILDLGMQRTVHKSRIYAFIKGVIDSGVKIKSDAKTFPDEGKISGKNLKKDFSANFSKIKGNIEK
ncbi:MAG: 50S ribosomal protein L18 [Nanoarchaeota archaeon]